MSYELLLPNGKTISEIDIDDLSMDQVFNILIKLNVATKTQRNRHKKLTSRSDSRIKYRYISRSATPIYYQPEYKRPWRGSRITPLRSPLRTVSRSPGGNNVSCTTYKSEMTCPSNRCYWTGTSCLTR